MSKQNSEIDLLFETSWEVCNKIGGIYAVLSTKARTLQTLYKDKVIFIGPDVWSSENPSPYFKESKTLLRKWRSKAQFPSGVSVRVGRWTVPGDPIVILVKFDGMYAVKDEFYTRMWDMYGVDSLHAYGDYDEACAFSHAAALVIDSYSRFIGLDGKRIIAHFDEWTTGMGLLSVKDTTPEIATVFTTHATSIGRSICGNNKNLYEYFHGYDGNQMAAELNMQSKHSLEKAAAHQADCFTTVSEVTAAECEQLLEIRPLVTPNGFEQDFVPGVTERPISRAAARTKLLNVASSLIGKKQPDDSFIVVTSGRCEYRNKGIDLFLDSVRLMAKAKPGRNIICYVMVPAWAKEPRTDLINSLPRKRKSRLPEPVLTHWLNNPESDPIINAIHRLGLNNEPDDRVKVIYVPSYLDGCDGIFDMTYYSLLSGMDATVFPSYYEPWGYTPLESIAFGVPTITTTLSGFGQWILGHFENKFTACGVNVIDRNDSNYNSVADSIAGDIMQLAKLGDAALNSISSVASSTSHAAAWQYFIAFYEKAYDMALQHAYKRNHKE